MNTEELIQDVMDITAEDKSSINPITIKATMSRNQFKTSNPGEYKIVKNPKTGKLFMTKDGVAFCAVSHKTDFNKPLQVIEFTDGGFCVCNESENNVVCAF